MDSINNLKLSNQNSVSFKSSEAVKPKYAKNHPDSTNFSMIACNENLQKNSAGYFQIINRDYNFSGTINNKNAGFDVSEHGLFFPNIRVEGQIGDKQISYDEKTHFALFKGKHSYSGRFGDNTFDLMYTNNAFARGKITGTINDTPVDIKIPGSKVPEDEDTRDLITTLMALNGQKAVTIGGKFRCLRQAQWLKEQIIENNAASGSACRTY